MSTRKRIPDRVRKFVPRELQHDHGRLYAISDIRIRHCGAGYLVEFTCTPLPDAMLSGPLHRVAYFGADTKCRWQMIAD